MSDGKATISQKIKDHPMVSAMTVFVLLSGSITAVANVTGIWDRAHTSESELLAMLAEHSAEPHQAAKDQLAENRRYNTCSTIDIKISIVEQQIWQMEQSRQTTPRLVEKRRELTQLEERRRTLKCADFS